jgi:hypothetical protein
MLAVASSVESSFGNLLDRGRIGFDYLVRPLAEPRRTADRTRSAPQIALCKQQNTKLLFPDNIMIEFKQYKRTQIAEMRPVDNYDINNVSSNGELRFVSDIGDIKVSISDEDFKNGSPKLGDMIARNPKNHNDQWLVAEKYFKDNFEKL